MKNFLNLAWNYVLATWIAWFLTVLIATLYFYGSLSFYETELKRNTWAKATVDYYHHLIDEVQKLGFSSGVINFKYQNPYPGLDTFEKIAEEAAKPASEYKRFKFSGMIMAIFIMLFCWFFRWYEIASLKKEYNLTYLQLLSYRPLAKRLSGNMYNEIEALRLRVIKPLDELNRKLGKN
jgi:hypothetical protein